MAIFNLSHSALSLDQLFKPSSPALVGADIGSSSVKMVELVKLGKGQFRLLRYAIEPLPQAALVDGDIANLDMVITALRQCHKKLGSNIKNLALALPIANIITKTVIIPSTDSQNELDAEVERAAHEYIPFSIDEVNLDYQVLGSAQNHTDDIEIFIAATRRDHVDDLVAVVEGAGLKPIIIEIDQHVNRIAYELIEAALPNHGRNLNIAIAHIGASAMTVQFFRDGQLLNSLDNPIGGSHLSGLISKTYGLSYTEAEQAKRKRKGLPDNYINNVLQPFMDGVLNELERSISYLYSNTSTQNIDRIILTGGCTSLEGLGQYIAEHTGISTAIGNPFRDMKSSKYIDTQKLLIDAPLLITACGLALRGFDA